MPNPMTVLHDWPLDALAALGLLALGSALFSAGARWGRRRERRLPRTATVPASTKKTSRTSRGDLVAAAIATAVSADGMWATFADLDMPIPLRVGTFAFIEIMVLQSARRARRSMDEHYGPGVDGIAMWVLTCLSAALSASHELAAANPNAAIVMVRLVAPLIAAWGWERNMRLERRRMGLPSGINWRLTPERIAVRLGLAEASDRTAGQVDTHRRLVRVARAADRARTLENTGAWKWRQRRASARAKRAMDEANEHAKLANDPTMQQALLELVGAHYNTESFVRMHARPWWMPEPAQADPRPRICTGRHGAPGYVALRVREPGGGLRTLHPLQPGEHASSTTSSLIAKLREQRTARRRGLQPVQDSARPRTDRPRTDPSRTDPPRTDPPRTGGPVSRTGVQPYGHAAPYGPATGVRVLVLKDRRPPRIPLPGPGTAPPRTDAPRTDAPPPEPPRMDPPSPPPGDEEARTDDASVKAPVSKAALVAELTEQIRTYERTHDAPWQPDYAALVPRTGRSLSFCEKSVRAARTEAARTGGTDPAPRTDQAREDRTAPARTARTGTAD